jgi:hypothetical protein
MTSFLRAGQTHTVEWEIVNRYGSWAKSITVYWYE